MRPGQKVEIQLMDEIGAPVALANVIPEIRLFHADRFRPRYAFDGWPTDSMGRAIVSFEDLEEERVILGLADLMDFNTRLTECDPMIEIAIPSGNDFQERRALMLGRRSRWRPAWLTEWPANWKIVSSIPRRLMLLEQVTHVDISVVLAKGEAGSAEVDSGST